MKRKIFSCLLLVGMIALLSACSLKPKTSGNTDANSDNSAPITSVDEFAAKAFKDYDGYEIGDVIASNQYDTSVDANTDIYEVTVKDGHDTKCHIVAAPNTAEDGSIAYAFYTDYVDILFRNYFESVSSKYPHLKCQNVISDTDLNYENNVILIEYSDYDTLTKAIDELNDFKKECTISEFNDYTVVNCVFTSPLNDTEHNITYSDADYFFHLSDNMLTDIDNAKKAYYNHVMLFNLDAKNDIPVEELDLVLKDNSNVFKYDGANSILTYSNKTYVSFGQIYALLKLYDYDVTGDASDFKVTYKDDTYEFSYKFDDNPYQLDFGYYYLKNNEKQNMISYKMPFLSFADLETMFDLKADVSTDTDASNAVSTETATETDSESETETDTEADTTEQE